MSMSDGHWYGQSVIPVMAYFKVGTGVPDDDAVDKTLYIIQK